MIWTIITGGIAGWLAGVIMKGKGYGIIINIVLGIIGSWLGSKLMHLLGFSSEGTILSSIITGVIGAVILIWAYRKFIKK
jgi:uncharacterized membrane protein YeaQ/YmgE (transglycosylase-associated protein family)